MTNPTFLQKEQVNGADQKERSQRKMAYITGIMSQLEGPGKQMREPFGFNQEAGVGEKKDKVWKLRNR